MEAEGLMELLLVLSRLASLRHSWTASTTYTVEAVGLEASEMTAVQMLRICISLCSNLDVREGIR